MITANFLANLWGSFFVITALSLMINSKIVKEMLVEKQKTIKLYCFGLVLIVIGIATILLNNIWEMQWMTIITVLGWISLLKGIFFIFFTDNAVKLIRSIEEKYLQHSSYGALVMMFVGLVLLYFGFTTK